MINGLQNQIYVYSVDTSAFYNEKEEKLHEKFMKAVNVKNEVKEIIELVKDYVELMNKINDKEIKPIDYEKCLKKTVLIVKKLYKKLEIEEYIKLCNMLDDLKKETDYTNGLKWKLKNKGTWENINELERNVSKKQYNINLVEELISYNKKARKYKFKINTASLIYTIKKNAHKNVINKRKKIDHLIKKNKHTRILNKNHLTDSNIISQFESTLTRSIGAETGKITKDIIVVRCFKYNVFKSLVINGFQDENGEKYQYFCSSAGQIRQKKSIFIKSKVYEEIKNKLMCGLSVKAINDMGGMNLNKFNAYTALCNTSSIPWKDFNINKSIVVPDFETEINDVEVDYIDDETYEIERKPMPIKINHVDGAGMYLADNEEAEYKSFQFRMPFFKGLIIPFPYKKFIEEFKGNPIIKDIYGKEHNVIKDDIRYIFTRSQFKMAKYFSNWEDYQNKFKEYNCEAVRCREDEEIFNDKRLNYQVIQSLYDMSVPKDEPDGTSEIEKLAKNTIDDINKMGNDLPTILRELGADDSNEKKYPFQQALKIYPNLINDTYSREVIMDKRKSMVKEARAGKLLLDDSKRTFIAPDLFAFCEWLFLGEKNPQGLLANGEVSCNLYKENQKLDVLRSPHNYLEHCIRVNKVDKVKYNGQSINISEYFISNNIFTSTKDIISKVLQFDVDGDESLIVADPLFVSIAEKHMQGIKPLQYKLEKAKEKIIDEESIYEGLIAAYSKSQKIGELANQISKIWNSGDINKEKLDLIKILCFESNACIDFAKTLWMPKRPPEIDKKLSDYEKKTKVPYFFKFAKDKTRSQVASKNSSPVNTLYDIVPKTNINFEDVVEPFDYKNLMSKKESEVKIDPKVTELYTELDQGKNKLIKDQLKNSDKKRKGVELQVYQDIRKKLLKINPNYNELVDMLVKYLYKEKESKHKQTLWYCFGNVIVLNLKNNVLNEKVKACEDCGREIERTKAKKYCYKCAKRRKNESNKKLKRNKKGRKNKAS